jgi:hypothetical protein
MESYHHFRYSRAHDYGIRWRKLHVMRSDPTFDAAHLIHLEMLRDEGGDA